MSASSERSVHTSHFLAPRPSAVTVCATAPTFSIVIAAYNASSTIGDAVASALEQIRPAVEVIVCDDGSTDDLDGALGPFREQIRMLRKPNGGGASALNHATRVAQGDFVAILDADDVYDPRRLEALGDLACARPDLDIISTDAYLEVEGKIAGRFNQTTPFVSDDQRLGILRSCFVAAPAVRRSRVLAAGGWDESLEIGYDWDCWLRLILDGAHVGLVDEPLMSYRLRAGSLTSDRLAGFRARVQLLEKAHDHPSLSRRERRVLRTSLRWQRSRLLPELGAGSSKHGKSGKLALRLARWRGFLARVKFAGLAWVARYRWHRLG